MCNTNKYHVFRETIIIAIKILYVKTNEHIPKIKSFKIFALVHYHYFSSTAYTRGVKHRVAEDFTNIQLVFLCPIHRNTQTQNNSSTNN